VSALGCLVLVARPAEVRTVADAGPSRDVLVCVDVSGSMRPLDAAVVRAVRRVVSSFPGDRVGLTVFDSRPVVKFPLTDDRTFVETALDEAETAFADDVESYYGAAGTGLRNSQMGDGLQSCVHGFDRLEERRGRVVLVVGDNDPSGAPVYRLADAARQARDRDITVFALGAPWLERRPAAATELRRTAEATGGSLVLLDERTGVQRVVEGIDRVERARLATPPHVTFRDRPEAGGILVTAGAALLGLLWCRRNP
jgi:Ca-activated chloride channel family protein